MRPFHQPHPRRRITITPFFELRNVTRLFRTRSSFFAAEPAQLRAVDGVSLSLNRGETLGLVGESGCGKSTLARMAVGLLPPSSGDILLDGQSILHGNTAFRHSLPERLQMVFQDPVSSLNPRRRIGKSIQEALDIHGKGTRTQRREAVYTMLTQVGLRSDDYDRYPHEFSGGQRQRIAVARALILRPDIVVCDEPVSALDVSVQAQVLNLLDDLQHQLKLTYLFISHDLAVVGHMSDRIAVMYLGRLVETASVDELFANPMHPYTQTLLCAAPIPEVPGPHSRKLTTHTAQGELPSPLAPPSGCPFHPRCPAATEPCSLTAPDWTESTPDSSGVRHGVRCHLHR